MQKRLNKSEAVKGLQVVVNGELDATIYTIENVRGNGVELIYMIGNRKASGGMVDYGICMRPTAAQLVAQEPVTK